VASQEHERGARLSVLARNSRTMNGPVVPVRAIREHRGRENEVGLRPLPRARKACVRRNLRRRFRLA
jgi:hypothetical protein